MLNFKSMCVWNEKEEDLKTRLDHGYYPIATLVLITSSGEQFFTIYFLLDDVEAMDVFQMAAALGQTVTNELLLVSQRSSAKMGRSN